MSGDILGKRQQGLETSYFRKQEENLLSILRSRLDRDAHMQAIREGSSLTDDAVIGHLVDCGIHARSLAVLFIVPLLVVGWADGQLDQRERSEVMAAATELGIAQGTEGWILLEKWLRQRPEPQLVDAWKEYVRAIVKDLPADRRPGFRDEILAKARRVAETSGGLLGLAPVSPGEKLALSDLEAAFD